MLFSFYSYIHLNKIVTMRENIIENNIEILNFFLYLKRDSPLSPTPITK